MDFVSLFLVFISLFVTPAMAMSEQIPTRCPAKFPLNGVMENWSMDFSITEYNLSQLCDVLKKPERWNNPMSTLVLAIVLVGKAIILILFKKTCAPDLPSGNDASIGDAEEADEEQAKSCSVGPCLKKIVLTCLKLVEQVTFSGLIVYSIVASLTAMWNQGLDKTSGGPDGLTWNMFAVMFTGLIEFQPFTIGLLELTLRFFSTFVFGADILNKELAYMKENWIESFGFLLGGACYGFYFVLWTGCLMVAMFSSLVFPGMFLAICVISCTCFAEFVVASLIYCLYGVGSNVSQKFAAVADDTDAVEDNAAEEKTLAKLLDPYKNGWDGHQMATFFCQSFNLALALAALSPFLCFSNHPHFGEEGNMNLCVMQVCRDILNFPGLTLGLHHLFQPQVEVILVWVIAACQFFATCILQIPVPQLCTVTIPKEANENSIEV